MKVLNECSEVFTRDRGYIRSLRARPPTSAGACGWISRNLSIAFNGRNSGERPRGCATVNTEFFARAYAEQFLHQSEEAMKVIGGPRRDTPSRSKALLNRVKSTRHQAIPACRLNFFVTEAQFIGQ